MYILFWGNFKDLEEKDAMIIFNCVIAVTVASVRECVEKRDHTVESVRSHCNNFN